jgi:membrane-bound lytic murein transglycosylase D
MHHHIQRKGRAGGIHAAAGREAVWWRTAAVAALLWMGLVGGAAAELFPQYEVLRPNVDFWVDVYARYPTTQAIVHDSLDLGIVYEVIDLLPYDAPGALKVNRQRMQRAQEKAQGVLKRLAANPQCPDADCLRVGRLFGTKASAKAFRRAHEQVRSQLGQKDRFQAGLIRSGAYVDQIRQILASHGLPEDLAYLPHVESSFNPEAYSKFGAAGLWQFMPATGKNYMEVGYVLDERRDPIRATQAAAELLKANHARLGTWPLAITAYNHGPSGMERAKRQHGDYPAIFTSYRGPTFKFASRNFYSEFLAARHVASNYRTYFGDLQLSRPVPTRALVLEGYARFEDLCAHFDVRPEVLKAMNPALRAPVFNNQKYVPKGYRLHLPADPAGGGAPLAAVPASLYQSAQKPSRFYTVQKGDTAGGIARTHGVPLADLVLANNLTSRATIYPRQTLRIPLPGETLTAAVSRPAAVAEAPPVLLADRGGARAPGARVAGAEAPAAPVTSPAVPPTPDIAAGAPAIQAANPTAAELPAEAAGMESVPVPEPAAPPVNLPADQEAPGAAGVPAAPASEAPPVAVAAVETPSGGESAPLVAPSPEIVAIDVGFIRVNQRTPSPEGELQVEVEETLGHYAEWAGVRTQKIRSLNGLAFGRAIGLGQKVRIPLEKIDAQAFEVNRYEYHKRLQEDFFAVYRVVGLEAYRVQSGDTIWSLCRDKFEVPLWLLKHYNAGVELAVLDLDQVLMIPLVGKTAAGDPGTVSEDLPNGDGPEVSEEQPG